MVLALRHAGVQTQPNYAFGAGEVLANGLGYIVAGSNVNEIPRFC